MFPWRPGRAARPFTVESTDSLAPRNTSSPSFFSMAQRRSKEMTDRESASHGNDSHNSTLAKQPHTNLNSRDSLVRRLRRGRHAREIFVDSHISKGLSFQTRSLRDREGWSQQELAEKIGSTQNAIYRAENPNYGKQTLSTLKKIAAAFDVALVVRFIPFSELVDWVSGTKHVDFGLSAETFDLPSFETEELNGEFDRAEPIQPQRAISEVEERSLLGGGETSQPVRHQGKGKLFQFDRDSGHRQGTQGGQENSVESSYAMGA